MVMDGLQHFIGSIIIRECIPCLLLRLMCTLVHVHSSAAIELVLDTSLSIWSNIITQDEEKMETVEEFAPSPDSAAVL